MLGMLGLLMPALPRDKPNHLLGIADERSVRGALALTRTRTRTRTPSGMGCGEERACVEARTVLLAQVSYA